MLSIRAVKRIFKRNAALSVAWYLMASYAYYVEDDPIIDDEAFEYTARYVKRNWWLISHPHKWLIDRHNPVSSAHALEYPSCIPFVLKNYRGQQ